MKKQKYKDLGELIEYSFMHIIHQNQQILTNQADYLRIILHRFQMQNAYPVPTLLPSKYYLIKHTGSIDHALQKRFQIVIGSLQYLILGTHLDIVFVVTQLAQYTANLSLDHLNKALYTQLILQFIIIIQLISRRILRDQDEAPEGMFYIIY